MEKDYLVLTIVGITASVFGLWIAIDFCIYKKKRAVIRANKDYSWYKPKKSNRLNMQIVKPNPKDSTIAHGSGKPIRNLSGKRRSIPGFFHSIFTKGKKRQDSDLSLAVSTVSTVETILSDDSNFSHKLETLPEKDTIKPKPITRRQTSPDLSSSKNRKNNKSVDRDTTEGKSIKTLTGRNNSVAPFDNVSNKVRLLPLKKRSSSGMFGSVSSGSTDVEREDSCSSDNVFFGTTNKNDSERKLIRKKGRSRSSSESTAKYSTDSFLSDVSDGSSKPETVPEERSISTEKLTAK